MKRIVRHRAQWKDIPGYEGVYAVSNFGQVKRLLSTTNTRAGKILTPIAMPNKYLIVNLWFKNVVRKHYIHRLVLLAFAGKPQTNQISRHLDGNRKNNKLINLAWGTPLENRQDALRHGTIQRGEDRYNAILTECSVRQIRAALLRSESYSTIAAKFNVSPRTVLDVKTRRTWAHV